MRLGARLLLLAGAGLALLAAAAILRWIGLGEAALLLAALALVVIVESVRYIWRQFRRGLRGPGPGAGRAK